MKVVSVRVENVKGLELADVNFDGQNVTIIGGENNQGKSSFLDAISMCLGGKKLFPVDPIREGEDEAEITMKLDGGHHRLPWPCTVTRMIKRRSDGVSYTNKVDIVADDGYEPGSPQTILTDILGAGLGFDPLAFTREQPKRQVDILRDLVGLDFTELDEQRVKLYSERTLKNRDAKELDGKIKKTPIHTEVPAERVSVSELVEELGHTEKVNAEITENEKRRELLSQSIQNAKARIEELKIELGDLREKRNVLVIDTEPIIDTQLIKDKLYGAEAINRKLDENAASIALREEKKGIERESKKLTKAIEAVDKEKAKMTAEADWPIEGLGFGPDGVVYHGTAFTQLSSSEQLRIAVGIALKLNPDFPFALIRDGSLLDEKSLAQLKVIVAEAGGQCLVERVSKGKECHVVFEEGRRVR